MSEQAAGALGRESSAHARSHDLTSLQCLRGVAAMMVVVFHALAHIEDPRVHRSAVDALAAGVDIFFVVSGFIMIYSAHRSPGRGAGRFLLERFVRVVPMYWLLSSVVVVIAVFVPQAMHSGRFDRIHAAASFLFVPVVHPVSGMYEPILIPGWTLNYEMFFYLIFALGLWRANGRIDRLHLYVSAAIALLVAFGKLWTPPGVAGFYTAGIMLEFVYGMLVGHLFAKGRRVPVPAAVAFVMLGSMSLTGGAALRLDLPREFLWGLPALAIVTGVLNLPVAARARGIRAMKVVGDASYSLYLVHPLVISALGLTWRATGLVGLPIQAPLFVVAALVGCIAAAFCLYHWVEQPVLVILKRAVSRSDPPRFVKLTST